MFILLSIHHPHPRHEAALIDSMHRYGAALHGRAGLRSIQTLKDQASDRLVGVCSSSRCRGPGWTKSRS